MPCKTAQTVIVFHTRGSMVASEAEHALLKAILQESANEVLVLDADSLAVVHANPAALKNLQYGAKVLQKLAPLGFLTPEDVPAFRALLAVLRKGEKRRTAFDAHCRRSDGTRYPVDARLFYAGERDRPVFIWMATDVSQREATREALVHSASDMRAIVAHIPGMAFQVMRKPIGPPVLRYVSEQSRQLLGIRASALKADSEQFFDLILEEDRPGYLARLQKSDGGHLSFNWEGRIWLQAWKDVKWVAIRVSRRAVADGTLWDGIMLNITHGKEAEAEIRRSRAALSALAAHVEAAKEQERLYLAREVHDDLGGNLTTIKIGLACLRRQLPPGDAQLAERVSYLDSLVDQTFDAAHRIAADLRPAALDFGIVPAIRGQLERFGRNTDIAYEFSAPDAPIPLDAHAAIAVFRIVQEGLTNIAKHARATRVSLELALDRDTLQVTLADNGRGVRRATGDSVRPTFGILGMTERAASLGGTLTVRPARRKGTELSLRIPLSPPAAPAAK